MISRRLAIKTLAAAAGSALFKPIDGVLAAPFQKPRFRIGACDWSIGQPNKLKAMEVASRLKLDGVQLSLGLPDSELNLRKKSSQEAYKAAAKQYNTGFSGLAIGELNNYPYKSDPQTEAWVSDAIDVARAMDIKVILLAFFNKGDLKNDPEGQKEVIRRLKKVAPKAADQGVILGIESWLSAEEHMQILEAVNSPNLKVYYDVANSHKMGYPIYDEIKSLGSNICEFHAKEYGSLLGKGPIDFKKVRQAIDDINYSGWLQIEEAVPDGQPMFESYVANRTYLRSVFPPQG